VQISTIFQKTGSTTRTALRQTLNITLPVEGYAVRLEVDNLAGLAATLKARNANYELPDIISQDRRIDELTLKDPFGNRIIFFEKQ